MPPTRRKSSYSRATQPTLAFNRRTNRITKPSSGLSSKSSEASNAKPEKAAKAHEISALLKEPETVASNPEDHPTTAELSIRDQVVNKQGTEEQAKGISDLKIEQYWRRKESERKAPRIHQKGLSLHDKILREFDLSYEYGPCIGIARTKRWKRAANLGLQPPVEVLAVLIKEDAKSTFGAQRAYPDELMSSKYALD